ncbi:MAG: pumilio domain member 6 [Cirrosporium novae-zelandiae]|nr:MAG: pumilio domain member 6 [Cirrosporium novae-zelandiae]
MVPVKRKEPSSSTKLANGGKNKKVKTDVKLSVMKDLKKKRAPTPDNSEELDASNGSDDFSVSFNGSEDEDKMDVDDVKERKGVKKAGAKNGTEEKLAKAGGNEPMTDLLSSKESHAKQKALAASRKSAKPNADSIARSKKLWERLRRKSHVPRDERKLLVAELYEIISGRVKEFVFKHDSVRVIQTALKYATPDQRKMIAGELKGEYKALAESKYAKFLIAKLLVHGDHEIRDIIIPEFYGNVKRLIRNAEASWIVDDIYRTVATPKQKAMLLREWYGPEFSLFMPSSDEVVTGDLVKMLEENPEKRTPIMRYLFNLVNQLVQKKSTGFTMLHDAMLQYFLALIPGSPEHNEFLELLKSDDEGDLLKNLAFTPSGSRLVCLALAYGNAKDRKLILRVYKDIIPLMANDLHAHLVLLASYEVIDDTVMISKSIFAPLLGLSDAQTSTIINLAHDPIGRITLLHLVDKKPPKWLHPSNSQYHTLFPQIYSIRTSTSKKGPENRRMELLSHLSPLLISIIASHPADLMTTAFGCQFITTVLLGATGTTATSKTASLGALADLALESPDAVSTAAAGRMLKALVQGGRFDPATKKIERADPALGFPAVFWSALSSNNLNTAVLEWAKGPNSFVIVAMVETEKMWDGRDELIRILKGVKAALKEAEKEGNKGSGILLQKISGPSDEDNEQRAVKLQTKAKEGEKEKREKKEKKNKKKV